MPERRMEPPFNSRYDCADLLGCPCCGGARVERFIVDRFIVLACADCGTYETETTSDR